MSIDGPKATNDQFRVFANGRGSYDIIVPKIKELLARHKSRPIAARVTLTTPQTNVLEVYRHLKEDLGFHEVGFAPVTTSPDRLYSIGDRGMDSVLEQFTTPRAGISFVRFAEPASRIFKCERYALRAAPGHKQITSLRRRTRVTGCESIRRPCSVPSLRRFGHSQTGSYHAAALMLKRKSDFLTRGNVGNKYDCQTCWARPLCAGGCHHEAFVRYGDTGHPNLHYCDWIQ